MPKLDLFLLGPPQVTLDNIPVEFSRRKALALLAYLAVTGELHQRDTLATLFWPDYDQKRARAAFRRTLSALNTALGGVGLHVDRETIKLEQSPNVVVDIAQFHHYLTSFLAAGHNPCETALPGLVKAVTLYRADFMAGFTLPDAPEFDHWQLFQSENLRHDLASALSYLTQCYSIQNEFQTAIAYAQRWLTLDPLHEPAHRYLMQLYVWNDQRAAALRHYQECVDLLEQELGIRPDPETITLFEEIQAGGVGQEKKQLQKQTATVLQSPAPMYNFPPQNTPFIDRQTEIVEILKRLNNPDCHLLTLIGPGGIGKTRLAIKAAVEHRANFTDGLYFIPLAPVSSPDSLVSAIADSLGLLLDDQEHPHRQLLNHLQHKNILLVTDNFEHLIQGRGLIAEILAQSPNIKVLATSRERLNLQGEWTFEVKGMNYPDIGDIDKAEDYSAVVLFLDKAHRIYSEFRLTEEQKPYIIRICQLVEGMPLGIELAAAWVRLLSCQEIAGEIERMYDIQNSLDFLTTPFQDTPARHQSLRAVFEHSWQLLSDAEKSAFRKLSVFRGGCHREAIEWVTETRLPLLSALVDKSLLTRRASGRYEIHELLRQYAIEKLRQAPAETEIVQKRHCEYYAHFLQQKSSFVKGPKQKETLTEIYKEIENIRSSWQWAIAKKSSVDIEQMLKSLGRFYRMYCLFREGVSTFEQAISSLQGVDTTANLSLIAQLSAYQGWFLLRQGLYKDGREALQSSISMFQQLEDEAKLALPLQFLGILAAEVGDHNEAKKLLQESLIIFRKINDPREAAWTLSNLGHCISNMEEGDQLEAKQVLQESLALYKIVGDKQGIAIVLNNLGYVSYQLGDYEDATQQLQDSLELRREIGYPRGIAATLNNLGHVASAQKDYPRCKAHYTKSLEITLNIQAIPLALDALEGLATPLAIDGETTHSLNILNLILHHPATNKETRARGTRSLSTLEPLISPEMQVIAQAPITDYQKKFEHITETLVTLL
ncbi:MAG: tetratricopeptide repeat protein [Chloroflexota bacterium]